MSAGRRHRAEVWERRDPKRYAEYLAAIEYIHRGLLHGARDWLGVDALIAAGGCGRIVVRANGREVSEAIPPAEVSSTVALRQQIIRLARTLAGSGEKRPAAKRTAR